MARLYKRPFTYPKDHALIHVTTASDIGGPIFIEITNKEFVNLGFLDEGFAIGPLGAWVSVNRGKQLDDLITALQYFREEGEGLFTDVR